MSPTMTGMVTNGVIVPNVPLPEGAKVEFVVVMEKPSSAFGSALEFLESLPAAPEGKPRACPTWEDYDRRLQVEKDSWDR